MLGIHPPSSPLPPVKLLSLDWINSLSLLCIAELAKTASDILDAPTGTTKNS